MHLNVIDFIFSGGSRDGEASERRGGVDAGMDVRDLLTTEFQIKERARFRRSVEETFPVTRLTSP